MSTIRKLDLGNLPSKAATLHFTDAVYDYFFPIGRVDAGTLQNQQQQLHEWLLALLQPLQPKLGKPAAAVSTQFISGLDAIYEQLLADAALFTESDPAVESLEEVILAYPGYYAIVVYRVAHALYALKVPFLPRMMSEYAHTKTGIDIHPGATIGCPFFIDHGTGIVIGQTSVIGNRVKIYQGVTLGALAVRMEDASKQRHPTIQDNVIIYAGSCILGGDTVIGHDSVIGGNVWLTESVPPFSMVYHKSEVHIRDKSELKNVIDFII